MSLTVAQFHTSFFGSDPTEPQQSLYASGMNGPSIAVTNLDEDLLMATFALGLYKTRDWTLAKQENKFRPVFFAIPKSLDAWASGVIKKHGDKAVAHLRKKLPPETFQKFKGNLKLSMENLTMGCRVFRIGEPAEWVAYGFSKSDPLAPEWVRAKLLLPQEGSEPTHTE